MKTRVYAISAVMIAVILVLAGLAFAGVGDLQIKAKDKMGNYLADGNGMTLYYFKNNMKDKNSCAGPCLEKWPVFYNEKVKAPAGSDAKDFGEFTRADGKKQTTFKGWPLYYFAGDKAAGDTNGQAMKDVWFTVNPISMEPCL